MSDAALSLKIAEYLEPKPDSGETFRILKKLRVRHSLECHPMTIWSYHFFSMDTSSHEGEWRPRDMVNDPAMTVMLIKLLIIDRPLWLEWRGEEFICGFVNQRVANPCVSIGRAVAEAFAKLKGILC